jgi:hypothetical protein
LLNTLDNRSSASLHGAADRPLAPGGLLTVLKLRSDVPRTARMLGITVLDKLLVAADEVIE